VCVPGRMLPASRGAWAGEDRAGTWAMQAGEDDGEAQVDPSRQQPRESGAGHDSRRRLRINLTRRLVQNSHSIRPSHPLTSTSSHAEDRFRAESSTNSSRRKSEAPVPLVQQ